MGKWFGKVGYAVTEETEPGLWEEVITEREYYGDAFNERWKRQRGDVNDDITVSQTISIVADPFAYQNFSNVKYVEYMDALWNVESIEVQQPRLILNVGGVYNGQTPNVTE